MADSIKILRLIPLLIILFYSQTLNGQQIEVVYDQNSKEYGAIKLHGLDDELIIKLKTADSTLLNTFFYMQVVSANLKMLGTYTINGTTVLFKPRFLPDPTVNYVVCFDPEQLKQLIGTIPTDLKSANKEVSFNNSLTDRTRVLGILPSLTSLPSNVLRFYISFSVPMSLQNPYCFISLIDDNGQPVDEPFVEIPEGLWNDDRTRLTVLFHPGRIKRGVGPNVKKGAIFQEGKRYEIRVSSQWKTASGEKLSENYSQSITIDPAVRDKIDLLEWKLSVPESESLDPLIFSTKRQLDPVLAQRMIEILVNEKSVVGRWDFDSKNSKWKFLPKNQWHSGSYLLKVSRKLEDISGNTVATAFDTDISKVVTEVVDSIPFIIE